eukprot:scaffold1356_cov123-Cylindrotheca_fusiformis.AAC.25
MGELIRKRVATSSMGSHLVIGQGSSADSSTVREPSKLKTASSEMKKATTALVIFIVLIFANKVLLVPATFKESLELSSKSGTAAVSNREEIRGNNSLKSGSDRSPTASPTKPRPIRRKGDTITMDMENDGHPFSIELYRRNDIVSEMIRSLETWEPELLYKLNSYFEDYSFKHKIPLSNLTFIDIGANVGWFAFNMAALGVKVIAFEPMQRNIDLINKSLKKPDNIESGISGRIELHPYGLGAKDAMCMVYSHKTNVGDGHVQCVEKEEGFNTPENYSVRGKIPVHRLDDVLDVNELKIVAIKMDTEGYEANVLEGGKKVLLEGGAKAILTEFEANWIKEKGGDPQEFMRNFVAAGYRLERPHTDMERQLADSKREFLSGIEMVEATKTGFLSTGVHELTLHHESYILEHIDSSIVESVNHNLWHRKSTVVNPGRTHGNEIKQAGVALVPKGGPSSGPPFGTFPPFSIRFGCYVLRAFHWGIPPDPLFVGASPHTPIKGFRHSTVQLGEL